MQTPGSLRTLTLSLCATLTGFGVAQATRADEPPKPMVLRSVMQQLDRDMQAVTAAIAREDWPRVAALAPKIGEHPAPPLGEKLRILAWLGTDAGKFRSYDTGVREASAAMGDAATRGDGHTVIAGFAKVQQACLGCHQTFRARFVGKFGE
ncbi:MAG TPA: cytochrome c [Rhodanobacteraceae bacterium]|nr:cytochrome c [Rhodanobacteraceae bacterium]